MERARVSPTTGFGSREPAETLSTTGKQTALAYPPVISYYYEGGYFLFGVAVPEGAVIPMELFGPGPFRDSVAIGVNLKQPGIAIGDEIRVDWLAMDGSVSFNSQPVRVTTVDGFQHIGIPGSEVIKFEGKTTEVIYVHLPQAGGATPSPAKYVYVAPALGSEPALQVEGVVDGVLDTSAYPDGIKVTIAPIENMRSYNAMQILWYLEPGNLLECQRRMTVDPQQEMVFIIDPVVYQPHVGKRVRLNYVIYPGAHMKHHFVLTAPPATEVHFDLI